MFEDEALFFESEFADVWPVDDSYVLEVQESPRLGAKSRRVRSEVGRVGHYWPNAIGYHYARVKI